MPALPPLVKIATRKSPMALAQTQHIIQRLQPFSPETRFEAYPLSSDGCYEKYKGAIADLGGKGAFTKALSLSLLAGDAHMAMHSAKDMPTDEVLPDGLLLAGCLPRDNPADALILPQGQHWEIMDKTAPIGTSSVRRAAQLRALGFTNPVPLRGNANTRLEKVDAGEVAGAVLAVSGLERLGLADRISHIFTIGEMLPAAGQGIVAMECATEHAVLVDLIRQATDQKAWRALQAERVCLHALQGNCHSAIAAHATQQADGSLVLVAQVYAPDGSETIRHQAAGKDAVALGASVGEALFAQAKHLLEG